MWDSCTEFSWYIEDISDLALAQTYLMYIEERSTDRFSEIFWEANRRGLTLDDLEQILNDNDKT